MEKFNSHTMKKCIILLAYIGMLSFHSCSNNLLEEEIQTTKVIDTRGVNSSFNKRTFNIGTVSESSLGTASGLASLCSNLYKQIHPTGSASGLKVRNVGMIGKPILRFETTGNSAYYTLCELMPTPGVYKITLKSRLNENDFNELMVRVTQTGNSLSLVPIDAKLYLTKGLVSDIVGDLQVRAQRWWPCFKGFFLDSDQGQAIMFIGALGGSIGQVVAGSFAGVVALACFG